MGLYDNLDDKLFYTRRILQLTLVVAATFVWYNKEVVCCT